MKTWVLGLLAVGSVAGLVGGCGGSEPPPDLSAGRSLADLTPVKLAGVAADELLLDGDGTTYLLGTATPAPLNADPPPRFQVRMTEDGRTVEHAALSAPVEYARLLGDGDLVVLDDQQILWRVSERGADVVDRGVVGAVGASLDGRWLVYAKGEMPDFEIYRAGPDGVQAVTSAMAPAWSPGVSADGKTVFFVSSRQGSPRWYRVDGDASPVPLTTTPFANGLGATLVAADAVIFESLTYDGASHRPATHIVDRRGRGIRTIDGAASPHWLVPGRVLGVRRGATVEPVALGADDPGGPSVLRGSP